MTRRRDVLPDVGRALIAGRCCWLEARQTAPANGRMTGLHDPDDVAAGAFRRERQGRQRRLRFRANQREFQDYENGKPQEISQFADADIPVTVGLVVDESGSMRPKRQDVITAALEFVEASNPHDEIFVVNFNERARRGLPDIVPFSDDIDLLRSALWQGEPEGRTALYDAMEMSLRQLDYGPARQEDPGGDQRRRRQHQRAQAAGSDARCADVVDDYLYHRNFRRRRSGTESGSLGTLAHVSGGVVYFPKSSG